MKWPRKPLEEVADFCLGKMLDQRKNRGDLMPYLANVNVRWGEFNLADLREMRFEQRELDRFGLRYGDIVMCEGGEPGRCAIWKDQMPGMMIQKAIHRIRPHDCLASEFLFYTFLYRGRGGHLAPLFTGATIKHLPREKLALVEVPIPPMDIQERIVDILSNYDELIQSNRRRIELLEQSARLLYKEWFVHLCFPGHEHTTVQDGLPVGWERRPLKDITTKIGSGATPRGGAASYKAEGIALIRSQHVYDYRFDEDGLAFIDDEQAERLDNVIVEPRDILLNITGASVARCCMVPGRLLPARVNQHVMIIRVDSNECSPHYILGTINSHREKQQLLSIARAGGATREALTKDTICNMAYALPPKPLLIEFDAVAEELFNQQECLSQQNEKLARARDLLLPRLMNGEIPV